MSHVEKAYQEFLKRNDKTKVIDGKTYYRIVCSNFFQYNNKKTGYLSVVPSPDMKKQTDVVYQDEKGNHFIFKGFQFIRFVGGKIPKWYFECGVCSMEWQETKNIGQYLTIIE